MRCDEGGTHTRDGAGAGGRQRGASRRECGGRCAAGGGAAGGEERD